MAGKSRVPLYSSSQTSSHYLTSAAWLNSLKPDSCCQTRRILPINSKLTYFFLSLHYKKPSSEQEARSYPYGITSQNTGLAPNNTYFLMHISQTGIFLQRLIYFSFAFHIWMEYHVFMLACWLASLWKSETLKSNLANASYSHTQYLKDISVTWKEESTIPLAAWDTFQELGIYILYIFTRKVAV